MGASQKAVQFQESFGQAAGVSLSQSYWGPVSCGHGLHLYPQYARSLSGSTCEKPGPGTAVLAAVIPRAPDSGKRERTLSPRLYQSSSLLSP